MHEHGSRRSAKEATKYLGIARSPVCQVRSRRPTRAMGGSATRVQVFAAQRLERWGGATESNDEKVES
jgi:hypothetical protein